MNPHAAASQLPQLHPWIGAQRAKLASREFKVFDAPDPFIATALRRSRFEISKFGLFDTFFVFSQFPDLDVNSMRSFSAHGFDWASKHKGSNLPNGFFQAMVCFSVAVTPSAHPSLQQAIREEVPPKHYSAFEVPVVYDTGQNVLYFYEKTPVWGGAYYNGFRKEIREQLL